jgi:uncharacterized repeat protein (TIGR03803 family)
MKSFSNSILFGAMLLSTANLNAQKINELWAASSTGGIYGAGTIFKADSSGGNPVVVHNFERVDGEHPFGKLLLASNGLYYGLATKGTYEKGVIFSYDTLTEVCKTVFHFRDTSTGETPNGNLIQATNGKIYGTTKIGGKYNFGVLYEFNPINHSFKKLVDFDKFTNGYTPYFLLQASNGKLYGVSNMGGQTASSSSAGAGTLFEYNIATSTLTTKHHFGGATNAPTYPSAQLIQATNGKIYGTTKSGGTNGNGTIFQYDIVNDTLTVIYNFIDATDGRYPSAGIIQASNGKLYGATYMGPGSSIYGIFFEYDLNSSTVTARNNLSVRLDFVPMEFSNGNLYGFFNNYFFRYNTTTNYLTFKRNFSTSNPPAPNGPRCTPVKTLGNKLLCSSLSAGLRNKGTIFEIDTAGNFTIKVDFHSAKDGSLPIGSLTLADNGLLYGVTMEGGENDEGTLFQIDPRSGAHKKLQDFSRSVNGTYPTGTLVPGRPNELFGTNLTGEVYKYLIAQDTIVVIGSLADSGMGAPGERLTWTRQGQLFGVSRSHWNDPNGSIFEVDTSAMLLRKRAAFNSTIGKNPMGGMIQARNGKLYGMTYEGGSLNYGVLYEFNPSNFTISAKIDLNNLIG